MEEVEVKSLKPPRAWGPIIALAIVFLVILSILAFTLVSSVGVSEVAIIVDPLLGTVSGTVIGPRYFFKMPWQYVVKVRYSVESLDMWTDYVTGQRGEWPAITALTKDGLEVHVDITVRWRIDPTKIVNLYLNYPDLRWEEKALAPLLRETVRNTVANYMAIETIEKRAEISRIISEQFIEAIKSEKSLAGAIVIEGIDLRNIELPEDFKRAVEQKLAEEQMKLAAQYKRERILIEANATATAKILEALGEAKAKIIVANSTAQALEMIGQVINASDIMNTYITYTLLKDIVAGGGNVYIVVVSGEGGAATVVPVPMRG